MKNYKNGKRMRFRSNHDRMQKRNGNISKLSSDFSNSSNFIRKNPGKNNHNAPKLIDKYLDLAREALSKGDKILSESYFQHADHFKRIVNEQQNEPVKNFYNKNANENKKEQSKDNEILTEEEKQSASS